MEYGLGRLRVYNKYTRHLGKPGLGGDWNPDSGTSHAVASGRTLCGVRVGTIRTGWELNEHARVADHSTVDCRRCRRSLDFDIDHSCADCDAAVDEALREDP